MRFITEEDLRQRFRRERFTEYEPEAGTRLTPGARQFLSDRGIRLTETENGVRPGNGQTGFGKKGAGSSLKQNEQPRETEAEERSQGAHPAEELPCWQLELGNLQADFLQAGLDLQREDVLVSKEIFELERNLARLASGEEMAEGERRWEMLCPACTGIGPENCRKCLADCFEITGFHAQSPNGRVVIRLHVLRSRLRKLERELPDDRKEMAHCIINRLSQMICHGFGGKICQKN